MMRSLRLTAAALAAVATLGTTAATQAAALPSTNTIAFARASATPSPNDIVMNWEGTCTNPGGLVEAFIDGPAGGRGAALCSPTGTFALPVMISGYQARGLAFGQNFDYWITLLVFNGGTLAAPATQVQGTATLR
jgi:hypothetical protein